MKAEQNNSRNLADSFMQFVGKIRKPVANYTFNREECYE
jgi:hypothetical protein